MRREIRNLGRRKSRSVRTKYRNVDLSEAREVRQSLTPIRTQPEVALEMTSMFGKRVTASRIEQIELEALQKIMDAFRAEREKYVDPGEELSRLKRLERKLWQRMNSGLTSGPKSG